MPGGPVPIRVSIDYDLPGLFGDRTDRATGAVTREPTRLGREVLRAAYTDLGAYWHRKLLPRHFLAGAQSRYGYRPRSDAYLRRKRRAAAAGRAIEGGTTPLVFTGLLRRLMTRSAVIRGFPTRARVEMDRPSYMPIRKTPFTTVRGRVVARAADQPPIFEEATRVIDPELNELANYLAERVTYHNERLRHRRRVRIG